MARRTIIDISVDDVEKRRTPSKHYVYVILVRWSDQTLNVVYRRYSKFFEFQTHLLDKFPKEAGQVNPSQRIIPFLPGKKFFGRSHIREVAVKRLHHINTYCKSIALLPSRIAECDHVIDFFEPTFEDLAPKSKDSLKPMKGNKISGPMLLEQYVAIGDYKKDARNEIDLHNGQLVEVVEKCDTGWWFVHTEEDQGWAPSSYLEKEDGSQDVRILSTEDQVEGEKYICCEAYVPCYPDEIGLDRGAAVYVLERNLDGWWLVRYKGQTGRAPATNLTQIDTLKAQRLIGKKPDIPDTLQIVPNLMSLSYHSSPAANQVAQKGLKVAQDDQSLQRSSSIKETTRQHPVRGIQRSESMGSRADLKSQGQKSTKKSGQITNPIPPPRKNSIAQKKKEVRSRPPRPPLPKFRPTYQVLEDFDSQAKDGISVRRGQLVTILTRNSTGWFFVRCEEKEGWAPASYIEQIPESKAKASEDSGSFGRTSMGIQSPLSEQPRVPVGQLVDISPPASEPQKTLVAPLTATNLATHDIKQSVTSPIDKLTLANLTTEHVAPKPMPPPAANKPTLIPGLEPSRMEGSQAGMLTSPDDYTEFTDFDSSEWDESEISSTPSELQSLYGNIAAHADMSAPVKKSDIAAELRAQLLARQQAQDIKHKPASENHQNKGPEQLYVNESSIIDSVDADGGMSHGRPLSQPIAGVSRAENGSADRMTTSLNMQQARAELEKIIINSGNNPSTTTAQNIEFGGANRKTSTISNMSTVSNASTRLDNEAHHAQRILNQDDSKPSGLSGKIEQLINPCKRRYVNVEVSQSGYPLYFVLERIQKGIEWELSLERGETVEVIERINSDWLYVKAMSGDEGWAPASFLSPLAPEGGEMIEGKTSRSEDLIEKPSSVLTIRRHGEVLQDITDSGDCTPSYVHTPTHTPMHTTPTHTIYTHAADVHAPPKPNSENEESSKSVKELAAALCTGKPKPLRSVQPKADQNIASMGNESPSIENELKSVQLRPVSAPRTLPPKPEPHLPTHPHCQQAHPPHQPFRKQPIVPCKKPPITEKPKLPVKPKFVPGSKPPATIPTDDNESKPVVNVSKLSKMFENNT